MKMCHLKLFADPQRKGNVFTGVCLSVLWLLVYCSALLLRGSVRILLKCFLFFLLLIKKNANSFLEAGLNGKQKMKMSIVIFNLSTSHKESSS